MKAVAAVFSAARAASITIGVLTAGSTPIQLCEGSDEELERRQPPVRTPLPSAVMPASISHLHGPWYRPII
jgi:hypothetical protein